MERNSSSVEELVAAALRRRQRTFDAPTATFSRISKTTTTAGVHIRTSSNNPLIHSTAPLVTPIRPRKPPLGSFVDLSTLSPIPEAESFSLEMPATPQHTMAHDHLLGSPMDVDSTTPSRTASVRTHHQQQQQQPQPPTAAPDASTTKRPLLSVFDWDDTLCPSWWLYHHGVLASQGLVRAPPANGHRPLASASSSSSPEISERDRQRFAQLEDHVLALLQSAMAIGPVFIITAATLRWVEVCAARFLPRVQALLQTQRESVRVVSAREWYHQHVQCAGDPMAWKVATFDALCAHLQLERVSRRMQHRVDFVSIGDSVFERDACRQIERKAPAIVHSKTLKFVDRPSLQELLDQVALTASIYERIRNHSGSLDLLIHRNTNRQKGDPTLKLVQGDMSSSDQPQQQQQQQRYSAPPPPAPTSAFANRPRGFPMYGGAIGAHNASIQNSIRAT